MVCNADQDEQIGDRSMSKTTANRIAPESSKSVPHPYDIALGNQLRLARKLAKISQQQLAIECGITFQQIQKYESGFNRISFSRLVEICDALRIAVIDVVNAALPASNEAVSNTVRKQMEMLMEADAIPLLQAYCAIKIPKHRRLVVDLAKGLTLSDS
jgi:transcriptional regulator with XRE-family HTH domain